ncbi:hypothetical protein T265_02072 [Opisthorchis viverrini]|uniref:Uncharacterized protein n=1 Tax=Opisthorchis viverrini TaxID=6198 RepID=A0A075A7S2_OPIVI|nr:hypothetical protein T265_02072 [Opisthorchis viverrini]KER31700.1 hypothetical protein T265_02072 [Opisthorchis viverrini]
MSRLSRKRLVPQHELLLLKMEEFVGDVQTIRSCVTCNLQAKLMTNGSLNPESTRTVPEFVHVPSDFTEWTNELSLNALPGKIKFQRQNSAPNQNCKQTD